MPPRTRATLYWLLALVTLAAMILFAPSFAQLPFPFAEGKVELWLLVAGIAAVVGTLLLRLLTDALWAIPTGQLSDFKLHVKHPEITESLQRPAAIAETNALIHQRLAELHFAPGERITEGNAHRIPITKEKSPQSDGLLASAFVGDITLTPQSSATAIRIHLRMLGSFTGTVAVDYQQLRSIARYLAGDVGKPDCTAVPVALDMALLSALVVAVLGFVGALNPATYPIVHAFLLFAAVSVAMSIVNLIRNRATAVGAPATAAIALMILWPLLAHALALLAPSWLEPPRLLYLALLLLLLPLVIPFALAAMAPSTTAPADSRPLIPAAPQPPSKRRTFALVFFIAGLILAAWGTTDVIFALRMSERIDVDVDALEHGSPIPTGWVRLHGRIDWTRYIWHAEDSTRNYYVPVHGAHADDADPATIFLEISDSSWNQPHNPDERPAGILRFASLPSDSDKHLATAGITPAPQYAILQHDVTPTRIRNAGLIFLALGLTLATLAALAWRKRTKNA